jgi:hypothetical protein
MAAAVDWQKRTILIWLNQQALRPDENPRLRGKTKMTKGLHAIETASRDEIVALQTERLKWTLNHVYDNVPHYQASFDAAGVHPDDFKSLDDLRKFPFTTKQDLRDNYPYHMFAVPAQRGGSYSCLQRHNRQTDRRRLYAAGYRDLG